MSNKQFKSMSECYQNVGKKIIEGKKTVPQKKPFTTLEQAYRLVKEQNENGEIKITGEPVDDPSRKEVIGVVDQEQYNTIKNRVKGVAVKPTVKEILAKSGKWDAITGFETAVVDRIANAFTTSQVSTIVLEDIKNNKEKLNAFGDNVKRGGVINVVDIIVQDIINHTSEKDENLSEKLKNVYNDAFEIIGTIATVGVGKGEIATTFFTNSIKGRVGDVELSDGTQVEIKGGGGRLGKGSYSSTQTAHKLADFLTKYNVGSTARGVGGIQSSLKNHFADVQSKFTELFREPQYGETLRNKLSEAINNIKTVDLTNLGFVVNPALAKNIISTFIQKGYINPEKAQALKNVIIDFYKFNSNILSKAKAQITKSESKALTPETIRNATFTMAVQGFFLSELGITPDQAAEAFLDVKSTDVDLSSYRNQIFDFFRKNYTKMSNGDINSLKSAIFALHSVCYFLNTGSKINYLLVMNNSSDVKKSVSIDFTKPDLFTSLTEQYYNNVPAGLKLDIKSDPQQGASAVSVS